MKILVIDDEQIIRNLIQDVLNDEGHTVEVAATGKEGIELAKKEDYELIFLDIRLPDMDGMAVLHQIKGIRPQAKSIIITAYPSLSTSQEALRAGAFDYIAKPFSIEDLVHCAKRAIEFKELSRANERLLKQLQEQNIALESKIQDRTEDLKQVYEQRQEDYLNTLKALCEAVEAKDSYTNSHSKKVALYSILIADEMRLSAQEKEILLEACQLHDLGKIGIPDEILKKPDKLSKEEFEIVKTHPMKAVNILTPLTFLRKGVIDIIRQHHERYDGKGYPEGLQREQIHIGGRILAVADTFDALYSLRPYRDRAMTKEEVIKVITENSGLQFDPKVVEAFLKVVGRF
jgi:putative two-component system response regulator